MPPSETGLNLAVLDAIENIAGMSPDVPAELIVLAHKAFATHEGHAGG